MIIAFTGNDGSGKTTIAHEISVFFENIGLRTKYKHEYEYSALTLFFRLIGREHLEKSRQEMLVEKKRSFRYTIWPYLVLIDLMMQFLYYKISMRNAVILLDRYPYDHYMSFKYLGNLTRTGEWLYLHFPKPDAFIVLTVDPRVAYDRKKATHRYSLDFYVEQTKSYWDLAERLNAPQVDTSGELKVTIRNIILEILRNRKIASLVIKRAAQNRVLYHMLGKYDLPQSDLLRTILSSNTLRKDMFNKSMLCLRAILEDCKIEDYALIKTFDDYSFVGNDIDVIVPETAFRKIRDHCSRQSERYHIRTIRYDHKKDDGKMDLILDETFKLDLHTYIGWDNMKYLKFDEIRKHITEAVIHGFNCAALNKKADSCVVALHAYEKGYLTLDEFYYLRNNFDTQFARENFPELLATFRGYFDVLDNILKSKPRQFPHFFSLLSISAWYFGMLHSSYGSGKSMMVLRNLALIFFWNLRYRVRGKLPFQIALNHQSFTLGV